MDVLQSVEAPYLRDDHPQFAPGDTIQVHLRVVEGSKERIQVFEGVVIGRRGSRASASFTVRKVSYGVGVERIFPYHSPMLAKVEVKARGRVRRSRLFYLRERTGKAARIRTRIERRDGKPTRLQASARSKAKPEAAPVSEEAPPQDEG